MKKRNESPTHEKRAVAIFGAVCALFALLVLRVAYIMKSPLKDAAAEQNTRKTVLCETRGFLYDRNHKPLVNRTAENRSVLLVCSSTRKQLDELLHTAGPETLPDGTVFVCRTDPVAENVCAVNASFTRRYEEDMLCPHILGYIDSTGKGVCGAEKAFDRILRQYKGKLTAKYTVGADGKALPGDGITLLNENYLCPGGLVLTIDSDMQQTAEKALADSSIECGAAVILDCRTFEILACASVPEFSPTDLAKYLNDPDLPFLNRAVSAYPVGSVFKPFIAAAALSADALPDSFFCGGETAVGHSSFRCFNSNEHGEETLFEAIANSCNTFFIESALAVGKEEVIRTCRLFGFGEETELFPGLISAAGFLPDAGDITNDAELALLSFGQGELLATPLQLAAAYSVLANGGTYREPVILKELLDETGKVYGYYKSETERKVTTKEICEYIGNCLYNNILTGTGKNAAPENVTAAGKTATAQTGRYEENGTERLCTWFAGYFPFDEPKYTVVIFNEKGSAASSDCAPVFKDIVDRISERAR